MACGAWLQASGEVAARSGNMQVIIRLCKGLKLEYLTIVTIVDNTSVLFYAYLG